MGVTQGSRTVIHLLGAADVGTRPQDFAQRLGALRALGDDQLADALADAHRPEAHHELPPLASLLAQLDGVSQVLLVATAQDPPAPGDTAELACLLARALRARPEKFGCTDVTVECLFVPAMDPEAFREATASWLVKHRPERVDLGIASGAKQGWIGVLLGCIEAGVNPHMVEANRQDDAGQVHVFDVSGRELSPWLARTRRFGALADLARDPEKLAWRALDAAQRLDWNGLKQFRGTLSDELAFLVPNRIDNQFVELMLASRIVHQSGVGAYGDIALVIPWFEVRFEALLGEWNRRDPHAVDHLRTDLARIRTREGKEYLSDCHTAMQFLFRPGDQSSLKNVAAGLRDALNENFDNADVKKAWKYGKNVGHGALVHREEGREHDIAEGVAQLVASQTKEDPVAKALEILGFPMRSNRTSTTVLMPVGMRHESTGGGPLTSPFVDAISMGLDAIGISLGRCDLRLLCTDATRDAAMRSCELAMDDEHGFRSALAYDSIQPTDTKGITEVVTNALKNDAAIGEADKLVVATGPGTKEMNLGLLLAAELHSFEHVTELRLAWLREARDAAGTTRLDWHERAVLSRLAADEAVGVVVARALATLDLDLAIHAVQRGSNRWDDLGASIDELRRHLLSPDPPALAEAGSLNKLRGRDLARALWPARVRLLSQAAGSDPWRVVHVACALAEGSLTEGKKDVARTWRKAPHERCQELWRLRNMSPMAHKPHALAPSTKELRELLEGAAREHHDKQKLPHVDVLVERWKEICRRAKELAPKAG